MKFDHSGLNSRFDKINIFHELNDIDFLLH